MFDLLSEILQSLRRNKFRTAMTGFAVVWGIFILVVLLGVSNGLENGMQANYGNRLSNSVDIWTRWTDMAYKGLPRWRSLHFTDREATLVKQMPEVEYFSRVASKYQQTTFRTESDEMEIVGVEPEFQRIFRKQILHGRFLDKIDMEEHKKVAVVDERAVKTFDCTADQIVGQYITVGDVLFRVVGVCEKGERWDGAIVYIPFDTHQMLYSTDRKFDKMSMTIRAGTHDIKTKIFSLLAPPMQIHPDDTEAIGVWSQEESAEQNQQTMAAIRLFIIILGLCTLISGGVGVSNIMLVSVRERTRELGIRKALGAPPATVMQSVVGEALAITLTFGLIGVLLGMGVVMLIGQLTRNADNQILVNPSVNLSVVAVATTVIILIGVIAGAIPALRAMKIKPIEAMREK
ncbi:MAG: ABC transporter permease [Paludibacteraceae bacterium]